MRLKVETIVFARLAGLPLDVEVAGWVGKIGEELADRLAAVGLIPPRGKGTLGKFL